MSFNVSTGAFNIGTGAVGTFTDLTLGYEVKGIELWWSGVPLPMAAGMTHQRGSGWAVSSSSQVAVCGSDKDAEPTSITAWGQRVDGCIAIITSAGVWDGVAKVSLIDSTKIRFEIVVQFTTDIEVSYQAYGGTDITDIEIGNFLGAGSAGSTQVVNNAGNFQPDITKFLAGNATVNTTTTGTDTTIMRGSAISAAKQFVLMVGANNGAGSGQTGSYLTDAECLAMGNTSPAITNIRATFVSHNTGPGGFSVQWNERAAATYFWYLSIKGARWDIGSLLTRTDGADIDVTGLAWQPDAVMFESHCKAETVLDTPTGHDQWSVGCATSPTERTVQYASSRGGNTIMMTQAAHYTDQIYVNIDPATDGVVGLGDLKTMNVDGFTAVMDDPDPVAAFVMWTAVAANAGGGGGDISAELNKTLGVLTSSAAATVDIAAELTKTLDALGLSSTATADVVAELTKTLGAATVASAATVDLQAALSRTLGALTGTSTATVDLVAEVNKTLGALTAVATAELPINATLAKTLGPLTLGGAGQVQNNAALAKTLGDLTLASQFVIGEAPLEAELNVTLGALTGSAAATVEVRAALAAQLGALTSAATGTLDVQAVLAKTLGLLTGVSAAEVQVQANLSRTLGALTMVGTLSVEAADEIEAALNAVLGQLTAAAAAQVEIRANLAVTLGLLTTVNEAVYVEFQTKVPAEVYQTIVKSDHLRTTVLQN